MSEIKTRLLSLRSVIKAMGADAFYSTLSDAHLSEYIQKADQFLSFLSGFTGSNAELLVTADKAFLWKLFCGRILVIGSRPSVSF